MKRYLHILSILLVVALLCLFPACKKEPVPDTPVTPTDEAYITDSVRYAADHMTVYNFAYPSTDPYGNPVMLSGTITLGDSVTRGRPAKGLVLYNHFTIYRADQCPTRGELSIQKIMARSPLITISADYYGFGITEAQPQAYCISSVNAQSSIDALIAARQLLTDLGYRWEDHLFNSGYSQGGQTAMGVVRLVAKQHPDIHFDCTYAGAGSYDIPATYSQFLLDTIAGMPSTVISVLLAYNHFFHLNIPRDSIFIDPLLSHIDDWVLSKRYTREEIDAFVGSLYVAEYVTPTMLDLQSTLSQRFLSAMQTDNLCQGWTPRPDEPIFLFHNTQDITVPAVNTTNLYHHLTTHGAAHVTLDLDDYGSSPAIPAHETGAIYFLMHSVQSMCQILGIQPWSVF
ncbi:MAG: hypothetical protein IJK84_01975 [Bacteroidales bacterium]|nr:hypothetical protein [Bacteroidales bacterium]